MQLWLAKATNVFLHDRHILQLAETPLHQNFLSHLELQMHGDFPSPTDIKDGHPSTKSEFHPTSKHSVLTYGEMTTVPGTIHCCSFSVKIC